MASGAGYLACQRLAGCGYTNSDDAKRPFSRVSGIVVEGVERHGCRESRDGPGMAHRGVPLEWRWSKRTRSEAQSRMQGQALLVPFGGAGHPGDCKRDPPSGAEPMPEATRKRSEQVAWK